MNNKRRKALERIVNDIASARHDLAEIREEEQNAFDNLPMSIQEGERGQKMEEAIAAIENAENELDNMEDELNEIINP